MVGKTFFFKGFWVNKLNFVHKLAQRFRRHLAIQPWWVALELMIVSEQDYKEINLNFFYIVSDSWLISVMYV